MKVKWAKRKQDFTEHNDRGKKKISALVKKKKRENHSKPLLLDNLPTIKKSADINHHSHIQ